LITNPNQPADTVTIKIPHTEAGGKFFGRLQVVK
jgi:hypothetical protein